MFTLTSFLGEAPKIDHEMLGNEQSTFALDVDYSSAAIEPKKENIKNVFIEPSNTKSIYLYGDDTLISWENKVDVVKSQIAQDEWGRIYITGDGAPKLMSADSIPTSYTLGVVSPEDAITIGSITENLPDGVDEQDAEDLTDDDTRFYIETFVTRFGEEGSNSPVSAEINVNHIYYDVELNLNSIISNTYNIVSRRIYRSATTDAVSGYFLVAELPLSTTYYVDSKLDSELGPELETSTYYAPPENMKGLVAHPSGFVVGYAGNEILMSAPYLPYAYPLENRHSLEYDVVALATTSDMTIVATTGAPYAIVGTRPDATDAIKLNLNEPCISKESMVDMGEFALYASVNGLVAVSASSAQLITNSILDAESWVEFEPETIHAYLYENKYIAFTDNGGFIFDPNAGLFSRLSETFDCGYHHIESGELYVSSSGVVDKFCDSNELSSFEWKSKMFSVPEDMIFSAAWIQCNDISKVGIEIEVNGTSVLSYEIGELSKERFRIPMVRGKKVQFTLKSETRIRSITFSSSMSSLK